MFVIQTCFQSSRNLSKLVYLNLWQLTSFVAFTLQEIIQDRDEERDRLRKEVHRMRAMLPRESAVSSGSMRPSLSAAAATTGPGSRPVSFISIEESSGPETTSASERNQESEDDGGKWFVKFAFSRDFIIFRVIFFSDWNSWIIPLLSAFFHQKFLKIYFRQLQMVADSYRILIRKEDGLA